MSTAAPHDNSYWVVPDRVLAGEYPGDRDPAEAARKLGLLLDGGVDLFIDLTEEDEGLDPYAPALRALAAERGRTVEYRRFPIRDQSVPRHRDQMVSILNEIDAAVEAGRRVYVHCLGGVGRTGTVAGCYLARHQGDGAAALERIAELWKGVPKSARLRRSPETATQAAFVRFWSERAGLPGGGSVARGGDAAEADRFRGCLLGLAVGDAVGTAVEFRSPGSFPPVTDMTGGGPFHLRAGAWTDDTSMALCLADSLLERQGFDAEDQMRRYLRWYREGYRSSTGSCFDVGNTVREALHRFERSGDPFSGSSDPNAAGNGSLMRLAPLPLFFAGDPLLAIKLAGTSSRTTHGAAEAVDACRYFAGLLVGALHGASKEELLSPRYAPLAGYWEEHRLTEAVDRVARGSFRHREPPAIRGTGYVVDALEAALWAFHRGADFEEGCLLAANLGDDADTTAAIYGQLAGAHFGRAGIPARWLERLHAAAEIEALADALRQRGPAARAG